VRTPFNPIRHGLPLAVAGALLLSQAAPACAAPEASGRWEGSADIPGEPLRLVVDFARDSSGAWAGSVILPGRGVKGSALDGVTVSDKELQFGLASAFPGPTGSAPHVALGWQSDGSLAGTLQLGGRTAPVSLHRSGAAQVDFPPASTAISPGLEGTWRGRYELGGATRDVTLTLSNRAQQGAAGRLVIVGKRTTTLELDLVMQGREFITLRASSADFRIEGRFTAADDTIEGSMSQGPFAAPIVLRHQVEAGEKAS
jgi:hypothetical protein